MHLPPQPTPHNSIRKIKINLLRGGDDGKGARPFNHFRNVNGGYAMASGRKVRRIESGVIGGSGDKEKRSQRYSVRKENGTG